MRALLDQADVAYEIDPTLVRGLDYYTRTVFEFSSDALGAQSGVGGGGRYDGLVEELGGPPTPGSAGRPGSSAWSCPRERTSRRPFRWSSTWRLDEGGRSDAFAAVVDARRAGLRAQMELAGRSLKGQLKHADRIGARLVAILGADGAVLRDMEAAQQEDVSRDALVPTALRRLRGDA